MSEIDEQKAKIDWLKDLFKIYIAAIFGIAAGLFGMLSAGNMGLLLYAGISVLIVVGLLATSKANEIRIEIRKLREM
jgi:lipoprotein signal peptidase